MNRVGVSWEMEFFSISDNDDVKLAMVKGNKRINFKLKDLLNKVSNSSLEPFKLEKNQTVLDS
jgi:hypothetical protein